MKKHFLSYLICILLIFNFGITGCSRLTVHNDVHIQSGSCAENVSEVSEFSGSPYEVINGNVPEFNEEDYTTEPLSLIHISHFLSVRLKMHIWLQQFR